MPEKLVYVKPAEVKEDIMRKKWLDDFGSYNRIPQPFLKIDGDKFADVAKRGTPEYIEYRMIVAVINGEDVYIPAYIYWYDDSGLMMLFDEKETEFYLLGCQHDFEVKEDGKGRTDFLCKICGYTDVVYEDVKIIINEEAEAAVAV